MKLSKIMMSVLALSLAAGTPALAKGKHKDDEIHSIDRHFNPKRLKELDLTAEQKDKLKAVRTEAKTEIKKCREDMKQARKDFKDALKSGASKEEVIAAFQKMTDKKTELSKSRLESILEVRDILTTEQRAKLFEKDED